MADKTKIEWTEATWNPITGCSVHSAGCTNCYAMKLAGTRLQHHPSRAGLTTPTKKGPVWNGQVRFNEEWLTQPLRWKRPRMIFVCAHADLFHEAVPDEWILEIFDIIRQCSYDGGSNIGKIGGGVGQHIFQILTKRSDRMRSFMKRLRYEDRGEKLAVHLSDDGKRPYTPSNVWLGVSVENNAHRDRIIDLGQTPAALRWISGEPLLDGLSLTDIPLNGGLDEHGIQWLFNALTGEQYFFDDLGKTGSGDGPVMEPLDWVVAGGESGKDARPMHPDWARSLRDQCAAAGTPFFFKQWGEWAADTRKLELTIQKHSADTRWIDKDSAERRHYQQRRSDSCMTKLGKKAAGRLLDGVEHNGMPT